MSNTMDSNGFDTGSNYRFGDKMLTADFPRSLFDLSHLVSTTIPNAGLVFPISMWRTLPTDEYDISVRSLLRVLPQVVPLYSRQRLYIYAFYSRMGDLWENWNTFARKGFSGNVVKTIPTLHPLTSAFDLSANCDLASNSGRSSILPDFLGDYLGFPIGYGGLNGVDFSDGKFSALPFMMYTRIWRDYFFNKNFSVGGSPLAELYPALFPDNDDNFRLNDNGVIKSCLDSNMMFVWNLNYNGFRVSSNFFALGLFYHDYPDDYFTSALPFQQRGEAPTLGLSGSLSGTLNIDADLARFSLVSNPNSFPTLFDNGGTSASSVYGFALTNAPSDIPVTVSKLDGSAGAYGDDLSVPFNKWLARSGTNMDVNGSGPVTMSGLNIQSSITLNSLRELAISQLELERMARTDGSYAEFGQVFFGVRPKNAMDYKPVYIGGSYTSVSFTEVLQTSASTATSALGQYAGHGIAADSSGYLGHVKCDDYGYIMILGCIMPDVYYSQGIDRHYTELNQSDIVLPDRTKLGMQPIYNQELFLQSESVVDADGNPVNGNLWAYQDVFDDYRYMSNRIHGKIADSTNLSFYPYTQARHFNSLPNWGRAFSNASNVRKDYLSAPSEDAYTAQFSIDVRAVRPLPYKAVPAQIIN